LIRGSIQAGLLAAIFAIGNLIAFRVAPQSFAYLVFAISLGRAFSITTFDTLLDREIVKKILDGNGGPRDIKLETYPPGKGIFIQTTVTVTGGLHNEINEADTNDAKEGSLQDGMGKMVRFPGNGNIV
jgi:hypothetical protein